ncbi:hypothetical protein [Erythrobacter sp. HL-111]|uniref:hypothetical protein n=1 Tax=Erythrobacter sp. HL-111 TaxID=1798193 RepID=UPI0012F90734|nr:hypothetical protein [Erythrobacter sp. HL-111]
MGLIIDNPQARSAKREKNGLPTDLHAELRPCGSSRPRLRGRAMRPIRRHAFDEAMLVRLFRLWSMARETGEQALPAMHDTAMQVGYAVETAAACSNWSRRGSDARSCGNAAAASGSRPTSGP